jgi:O-antigen ligase
LIDSILLLCVFAALPTVGLVNGPIYAPLLFGLGVLRLILARGRIDLDMPLARLACAFALLCWVSCLWSIVPGHSAAGVLQTTGVLAGALILLAGPPAPVRLASVLGGAVLAGAAVMVADRLTGNHLLHLMSVHEGATKYNRGIDYLLIILMPLLALLVQGRRWRLVAALAVACAACVAAGRNTTAFVSLPGAVLLFCAAWRAPRLVARAMGGGLVLGAIGLPFALRLLSGLRGALAPHIKESLLARLEIWDYVSARVLERPLFGWGIWSAKSLPISAEELSHYVREHGQGIYPHNQWLELWVETGVLGVALALGFVLLVLSRIQRMAQPAQAFALTSVFLALMVSLTSFEITTDSWWAALAACTFLFRQHGQNDPGGRPAFGLWSQRLPQATGAQT